MIKFNFDPIIVVDFSDREVITTSDFYINIPRNPCFQPDAFTGLDFEEMKRMAKPGKGIRTRPLRPARRIEPDFDNNFEERQ